jgi:hypothetical protein
MYMPFKLLLLLMIRIKVNDTDSLLRQVSATVKQRPK